MGVLARKLLAWKTTINLSNDSRYPDRISNPAPPEYCDAYTRCWATTQYTRSSKHETIGVVFSVDRATAHC
jgi:hypothetical protein